MNRVLNVILVSGLACTLACAPETRHQQVAPPSTNKGAKPNPAQTPAPSVVLTPTVVPDPNIPLNKYFDPATGVLTNAQILPPKTTDKAGSLVLAFTEHDSKNEKQSGSLTLDGSATVKSTDANFSNMTYSCDTPNVTPNACPNIEVKFTWNKLVGDATVALAQNLMVTKAIDAKSDATVFGGAVIQKLILKLGNSDPFTRINSEIVKSGLNDSGAPDDKQLNSSNMSIMVFGLLPAVDLDGSALHTVETLNGSSGRMSSIPMSATTDKEHELIYTLGMLNDANEAKLLTLTISIPLNSNVVAVADGSDAAPAPAATAATAGAPVVKPDATVGKGDGAAPGPNDVAAAAPALVPTKPVVAAAKPSQLQPQQQQQQNQQTVASNLNNQTTQIIPTIQTPTTTNTTDVVQKDFCKFRSSVDHGEWVEQNVDIVNGKPGPLKLDEWMRANGDWKVNFCDSTTGRLATAFDAPGAVSCLSKAHLVGDESTETIIFGASNLSDSSSCYGRLTHYKPGTIDLEGVNSGCFVRPLDSLSLHVANTKNLDGNQAFWSDAKKVLHQTAPKMWAIPNNPGQYEVHNSDNMYWDIFAQPNAATTELQCWGRTTKYFSSIAQK